MAKLTLFHFTQELMSLVSVELVYYLSIILHIFKIYIFDSSKNEPSRLFRLKKPVGKQYQLCHRKEYYFSIYD